MDSQNKKLIELANSLSVEIIYDCGSRDAEDGLYLLNNIVTSKELHIFEPNPMAVNLCRNNIKKDRSGKKIFMNEVALSDKVGKIKFYPIDPVQTITPHKDGNIGASSIFKANNKYKMETYVQKEIEVNSINLDTYIKTHKQPDMLWVDLQGAELLAFRGGEHALKKVKIIFVEVTFREMYQGQALFSDVNNFLKKHNFKLLELTGLQGFKLWSYKHFSNIFNWLGYGMWFTNAIYIKKGL